MGKIKLECAIRTDTDLIVESSHISGLCVTIERKPKQQACFWLSKADAKRLGEFLIKLSQE